LGHRVGCTCLGAELEAAEHSLLRIEVEMRHGFGTDIGSAEAVDAHRSFQQLGLAVEQDGPAENTVDIAHLWPADVPGMKG